MIQKAMMIIALSKKEKAGTITAAEKVQLANARGSIMSEATKVELKISDPFNLLPKATK